MSHKVLTRSISHVVDNRADSEKRLSTSSPDELHLHDAHVPALSRGMVKLYGVWAVAFLATFMAGYAIAAMTAINAMTPFQDFFDFDGLGVSTGLVFSLWPIAACVTFWLGPILSDRFGRRKAMLVCSILFFVGTALIAFARNLGMLLAGRVLLGMGVGMSQAAAPPYIVELSPPVSRGKLGGFFNVSWVLGGVIATGISIGTSKSSSEWSWRVPMIVQLLPPSVMIGTIMFLPESPRWLFANSQADEAQRVLVKYHGNGVSTPLVELELRQISEATAMTVSRWNYRSLFKTRAARYRVMLAIMMASFGQLSGNALSYFLPALYKQVGVNNVQSQLVMTMVATLVSLVGAIAGSYCTDRLGRRPVLIFGTLACAVCLAGAMATSATSHVSTGSSDLAANESGINHAASRGAIAFLILFGGAYGWGYQPLLGLYPSEVMSLEQRGTGMGLVVLTGNLASFINQFAVPIALQRIGWWTYLPFICWDLIETVAWWLLAVETRHRTLEELDEVFESPNPVKASLAKQRRERATKNSEGP